MDGVHSWWRGVSPFLLQSNTYSAHIDLNTATRTNCRDRSFAAMYFAHLHGSCPQFLHAALLTCVCTRERHLSLLTFLHDISLHKHRFIPIKMNLFTTKSCDAGYFPLTMREMKSLPFWINAWQLWGSIGFLISAAAPYKLDITWKGELIELIFGSLIGSIWFWLNGWGLYLEIANPHAD
jgi:hypothetical protein